MKEEEPARGVYQRRRALVTATLPLLHYPLVLAPTRRPRCQRHIVERQPFEGARV